MKATGIVRRIDDLGRVVIPKEIRRTLRIREGDPLEIFTEREGSVILRKYSPIGEIGAVAGLYAESLAHTMNCIVCLTDMDQIVAASGSGSKELLNRYISKELEYAIQARKQIRTEKSEEEIVTEAKGKGIKLAPLSHYFDGEKDGNFENTYVINYSSVDLTNIEKAAQILYRLL